MLCKTKATTEAYFFLRSLHISSPSIKYARCMNNYIWNTPFIYLHLTPFLSCLRNSRLWHKCKDKLSVNNINVKIIEIQRNKWSVNGMFGLERFQMKINVSIRKCGQIGLNGETNRVFRLRSTSGEIQLTLFLPLCWPTI